MGGFIFISLLVFLQCKISPFPCFSLTHHSCKQCGFNSFTDRSSPEPVAVVVPGRAVVAGGNGASGCFPHTLVPSAPQKGRESPWQLFRSLLLPEGLALALRVGEQGGRAGLLAFVGVNAVFQQRSSQPLLPAPSTLLKCILNAG